MQHKKKHKNHCGIQSVTKKRARYVPSARRSISNPTPYTSTEAAGSWRRMYRKAVFARSKQQAHQHSMLEKKSDQWLVHNTLLTPAAKEALQPATGAPGVP